MRLKLVFVALAALGSASCGRTHQGGASEGNGPGPCTLDCQRVCQLAASCGAMPEGACLNACQLSSAQPPQIACLQQLICGGSQRCDAVNQCVVNPTVPDLVVSSFNATSPGTGQLSYVATVCNRGTGLATGISVDFYRNRQSRPGAADRGEVTTSIRALDPGQCESVSGSESGLASGTYRSYVQVDAARRIVEINEGNNVGGPDTTTVQGNVGTQPDLTVRLTVTVGSQVGTGRSVRYSARICNNGAQTAGASRVDIYYDRASRPSTSSAGNRSIYVSSLPAGS